MNIAGILERELGADAIIGPGHERLDDYGRDESPLPGGPFKGRLVYDLTYGSGESRLLREARAAGCRTLDGLLMLVAQAERQFEWWTGHVAPPGVMERAVRGPRL